MTASREGAFDVTGDIGGPALQGSTAFDGESQIYKVAGGGANIWGRADQFHFAALEARGDFMMSVEASFEGEGANPHRKWGLMIRGDLSGGSAYADAAVHGDGLSSLQYRPLRDGETSEVRAALSAPDLIQLERAGGEIVMRAAKRGEPLAETCRIALDLGEKVYAGIFVCSHESDRLEAAVFRNFRLDRPAPAGADGYESPSPSRLEILDVDSGLRRVIHATSEHIEAPNWSRDGSYILYNQDGRIYRLPLDSRRPELLPTGAVRANNNDHGISFDGKLLALSSHTEQPGRKPGSQIYVVSVEGGEPVKLTDEAPSYWHGWSPDGSRLVYCAERGGNYDVYSIGVEGGPETRLTTDPGLDDGPEYSPDGEYVYFNSTRSGRMKIWRMRPDGSGQVLASPADDWNDWFAHISPDGSRMAYVSYPSSVPADSHPRNQRVVIRLQDLSSGEARVIAYLYGGQGTMNVPSWSPDGRSLALVSYTYGDPAK